MILIQNENIDVFNAKSGYQCTFCDYKLSQEGWEIFDNQENLKPSLSDKIKMALLYIVGYMWNDN